MITAIYLFGYLMAVLSLLMGLCTILSLGFDEPSVTSVFLVSSGVVAFVAGGLILGFRGRERRLVRSQAYALAGFAWAGLPVFMAIPVFVAIPEVTFVDAYVDSAASFTTAGGRFLSDFNTLPDTVKLWRGFCAWLGGALTIGVVIVILGPSKVGGIVLGRSYAAEFRSFTQWERIVTTARRILPIYATLTGIVCFVILLSGVRAVDALVLAFGSISTAGIATTAEDIGAYGSRTLEFGVFLGMVAGATGFFWMGPVSGSRKRILSASYESQIFCAGVVGLSLIAGVAFYLGGAGAFGLSAQGAWWEGLFASVSLLSTTGYELRPGAIGIFGYASAMLIAAVGCATVSSGGGQKLFRISAMSVYAYRELERLIYPHSLQNVHVGPQTFDVQTMKAIWAAFAAFCVAYAALSLPLSLSMTDFSSTLLAAVGAISTMLPLYESAWPMGDGWVALAALPPSQKLVLVLGMIAGRVEVIALLSLMNWRLAR